MIFVLRAELSHVTLEGSGGDTRSKGVAYFTLPSQGIDRHVVRQNRDDFLAVPCMRAGENQLRGALQTGRQDT